MTSKRFLAIPASIFVLTLWFMPNALAQCGLPAKLVHPASWHPQDGNVHLMRAALSGAQFHADEQNGAAIVGMWHVTLPSVSAHDVNPQGETTPVCSTQIKKLAVADRYDAKLEFPNVRVWKDRTANGAGQCRGVARRRLPQRSR
jgi:hypothetical protein